jgi:hypothetical protein
LGEKGERERKRMKESSVREKCVRDKRLSECENFAKVYECVCVCVRERERERERERVSKREKNCEGERMSVTKK